MIRSTYWKIVVLILSLGVLSLAAELFAVGAFGYDSLGGSLIMAGFGSVIAIFMGEFFIWTNSKTLKVEVPEAEAEVIADRWWAALEPASKLANYAGRREW